MRVFVAGAGGAVGRHLVPQLVARGHDVIATTQSARKLQALHAPGVEPMVMDGLDPVAVGKAVARAAPDVIVHEMTALATKPDMRHFDRWFQVTNELRTRGTEHLLAAARAAGVPRFVAQSYTGWTNARTGGPVKTEEDPLDPRPAKWQRRTLDAIRRLEHAVTEAAPAGVALRYGSLYGPGASEPMIELVRSRRLPIVGDGAGIWSWIHVADAAGATVTAVEGGAPGVYHVVDDEPARVSDWLPYLAEAVAAKPPPHVPRMLARLLAGEVVVRVMTESRGASNTKAKRELGWEPAWPTWRDGFRHGLRATKSPRRASPIP